MCRGPVICVRARKHNLRKAKLERATQLGQATSAVDKPYNRHVCCQASEWLQSKEAPVPAFASRSAQSSAVHSSPHCKAEGCEDENSLEAKESSQKPAPIAGVRYNFVSLVDDATTYCEVRNFHSASESHNVCRGRFVLWEHQICRWQLIILIPDDDSVADPLQMVGKLRELLTGGKACKACKVTGEFKP